MKIASYNLENLFMRAVALNGKTPAEGKKVLQAHAEINAILNKDTYTPADKKRVIQLMKELRIDKKDDGGPFAILRQNRGHLVTRSKSGLQVVADGRSDWIGWVDLKREEVNEVATQNTARVINEINADILGVVEAESRPALLRFSEHVIGEATHGTPYAHAMLIDGNDDRGIDVAVYTRKGFDIVSMCSHVDDEDDTGKVFSRDCAMYEIRTPSDRRIHILVNHFKSKGFGSAAASDKKRQRQAARVKEIYDKVSATNDLVAVLGDLNDTPDSQPLAPLLAHTNLKDISQHPAFDNGGRPGTFRNGTAKEKIDYILMSPALFAAVDRGGIFRKGVWGGKNGTLFPHFPEITKSVEAASDHAAIWAEMNI